MKKVFILIVVIVFSFFYVLPKAQASLFDNSYLRLDTLKSSSPLSGTVCAQPSSAGAGTESKVTITFPSDFSISSTTSNWTTGTSNLPSGATAWPSIGVTATTVSGQSVTFSSDDLTSNTLYCFNFTASSSTTGNSGNDKTGTIITKDGSNTTINSDTYGVSILSNNQIAVTASVDPQVSDLPIAIDSDNAGVNMPQNTTITYTITYGLNTLAAFPLTVTASWSQGTIQGNPLPSVDIVDYVVGSASNGYNSTHPSVDLINNKITWTYNSFPAQTTGQTVSFKLKTNSAYTGTLPVSFDISANSNSNSTTTPDQTLTQTYKYDESGATPTPTPTPTSAPSSTTATPTPTPIPGPSFNLVDIRTISDNNAGIFVSTTANTKTTLLYGTSFNLSKSVSFSDYSISRLINLKDLQPNTQYYFKIVATDLLGNKIISDIFTFTTAQVSTPAIVNQNSIIIVSGNNSIFDSNSKGASYAATSQNPIIIPKNTSFQFNFSLQNKKSVKKIRLLFRKISGKNVLAGNTLIPTAEANAASVTVLELTPGVYTAVVDANEDYGTYEILVSFIDENGNLVEQRLATIKISNPFTVLDKNSMPIEGVRVFLYVYNESEKTFIPLSPAFIHINNPIFTDNKGVASFVFPKGQYKAQLLELGYREKTVTFTIGNDQKSGYPIVYLEKTGLNIVELFNFYWYTFNEVFLFNTYSYVSALQNSIRFFDLIATFTLSVFVFLTLFAFSKRHHIPLSSFISYFFYLLNHKERNKKYINGAVFDQVGKPMPLANVYLTDVETEQIIQSTKTNSKGEFFFKKGISKYSLMVMKKGYQASPQLPYEEKSEVLYKITMEQKNLKTEILDKTSHILRTLIGVSFETLLFSSLIFEILFIQNFGIVKTLPFISVSIFNLTLWVLHRRINYRV